MTRTISDSIGDLVETLFVTNLQGENIGILIKNSCDWFAKNPKSAEHVSLFGFTFLLDKASKDNVSTYVIISRHDFLTLIC